MTPDLGWWGALFGRLAVQAAALIALGATAAFLTRSAQLRRALWQAVFVALAVGWLAEIAGLPGKFTASLRRSETKPRLLAYQLPVVAPPASPGRNGPLAVSPVELSGRPLPQTSPSPLLESEVVLDEVLALPPVALTPPSSRPVAPAVPLKWPGWFWLCGTTMLLLRLAATRAFLALRRRRQTAPGPETEALVSQLRGLLGLRRVSIEIWPDLPGPIAFGIWRPTVALPADFGPVSVSPLIPCSQAPVPYPRFTPVQRDAMLAHELAHLAARDPFWLALADAVVALAWWHPAVWWARRRLRAAGESAADEASALVPSGPSALAESLLVFGRELAARGLTRGLGVAGNGFRSDLSRRVLSLLSHSGDWKKLPAGRRWGLHLAALGIAAVAVVVPVGAGFSGSVLAALATPAPNPQIPAEPMYNLGLKTPNVGGLKHGAKVLMSGVPVGKVEKITVSDDGKTAKVFLAMDSRYQVRANAQFNILSTDFLGDAYVAIRPQGEEGPILKNNDEVRCDAPFDMQQVARTNLVYSSEGRRRIKAKLESIRLPEFTVDGLPLVEVLKKLTEESIKRDPDRIGINFAINSKGDVPPASTNQAVRSPTSVDLGTIPIKIKWPFRDIKLANVVDAICLVAEQPITYDVDDYAVVFIPRPPPVLSTRLFRIELDTFLQGMKRLNFTNTPEMIRSQAVTYPDLAPVPGPLVTNWGELVREYFSSVGTTLDPPKYVYFNERAGLLMVHATETDVNFISGAIEMLNKLYAKSNSVQEGLPSAKPDQAAKVDDAPGTNADSAKPYGRTNLVYTSEGRRIIKARLERIRLPEISFDRLPLVEVLKKLTEESIKHDPDRIGINFAINSKGDVPLASTNQAAPTQTLVDLGTVSIKINPPLRDIKLANVLDAICQVAEQPITYDLEDDGVTFIPRPQAAQYLITRTFRVNSNTFVQGLQGVSAINLSFGAQTTGGSGQGGAGIGSGGFDLPIVSGPGGGFGDRRSSQAMGLHAMVRDYFTAAGIDLNPPKWVFFNDRAGLLMVRASEDDINAIRSAVEMLNQPNAITNAVPEGAPGLTTRTFHLNATNFIQGLQTFLVNNPNSRAQIGGGWRPGLPFPSGTNTTESLDDILRKYFNSVGVNLDPPKYVFFNDKNGLLMTRASQDDFTVIRGAIEFLQSFSPKTDGLAFNLEPSSPKKPASAPPSKARNDAMQVSLLVRFTELPEQSPGDLGLDWLFGQSPTNDPPPRSGTAAELLHAKNLSHTENFRVDASRTEGQWAILNESQYAGLIHTIEQKEGVDVLTGPSLYTDSGQQSHLGIQDMLKVVSAVEAKNGSPTNKNQPSINYLTEQIGVGPTLDVTPVAVGGSWRLNALAGYTEFLGYDQPGTADEVAVYHDAASKSQPVRGQKPLPHFRAREAAASALLAPGQTLALRGPSRSETNHVKTGLLGIKKTEVIRMRLYVFVTVQTVTDTGYVVRTIAVHKRPPYLTVESKEVAIEELRLMLRDEVARDPDLIVQIRPDRDAPVGEVLKVIDAAKEARVKVPPKLLVSPNDN